MAIAALLLAFVDGVVPDGVVEESSSSISFGIGGCGGGGGELGRWWREVVAAWPLGRDGERPKIILRSGAGGVKMRELGCFQGATLNFFLLL